MEKQSVRKSMLLRLLLSLTFLWLLVGNARCDTKTIEGKSIVGFGSGYSYGSGSFNAGNGITITSNGALSTLTTFRIGKSKELTFSIESGKITEITIIVNSINDKLNASGINYTNTTGKYKNENGVTTVTFKNSDVNIALIYQIIITYAPNTDSRTPVNLTSFTTDNNVTSIAKGNTLATLVSNDQSGWNASYSYSSDNESVATISASGVITAVSKGTAKIKATLNVDKDDTNYKEGSVASKTIDVTVTNPTHKVYFSADGIVLNTDGTDVEEGEEIDFQQYKPSDVNDYKFVGWYGSTYQNESTAPEFVTSATMGQENVTYYAVFATIPEGGVRWTKTAPSAVTEGVYAIITNDGHAFNGTINNSVEGQLTSTAFSFVDEVATSAPEGTIEFVVAMNKYNSGYTMYNENSGYLYVDILNNNVYLSWHNTENSYWSYTSSNWEYHANNYSLRDNQNISIKAAKSGGSMIMFAKKSGSVIYSNYTTTVPAPLSFVARSSEGYWATFSSTRNAVIPKNVTVGRSDVAVTAYAVSVSGEDLVLAQLDECLIDDAWHLPANTGYLLNASYGVKGGLTIDYTFEATSKGSVTYDNFLMPGLGATTTGNGCKFYRLAYYDYEAKTGLGFYYGPGCNNGEAFMCKAGTAYLAVPNNVAPNVKSFVFDGSETAVSPVRAGHNGALLYNLNGQRVSGVRRGVYVKNGKKIFVK
ncbi:MAG: Ig-like domain-containing protein [Bacteroidales bacterium]|nr:Ig-like domain-containing protein [Bacteroidales bacterium]